MTNCGEKIKSLFEKYENNPYMFHRLNYHIMNILPSTLENECKNHEKRVLRNNFLTNEQQIFIQVFLSKNRYYYLSNNASFYKYHDNKFYMIKEDDIQYQLLSTISKDRTLMQWKYKTKLNIIKQIKERNLFKSIPETDTIQNVLNYLYPSIFSTKDEAKYFLTIIGDNILKKNNENIYFIKPKTKKYLNEIERICYLSTGVSNITHNFMTKYHENYKYENCRILKLNNTMSIDIWKDILKKNGLDFICVAAHYSNRYENSDNFILNHVNDDLKNYSFFLKNSKQSDILDKFCSHSIENVLETDDIKYSINWKNMHYIWKLYISKYSLPSVIYSNTLKNLLKETFLYDENTDAFLNVTSKYLPCIHDFIQFWDSNIKVITNQYEIDNEFDNEFEIEELYSIFKKWNQNENKNKVFGSNIGEHNVLKILNHYFPNVDILENKYILNISCSIWDKTLDIKLALNSMKEYYKKEYMNNCIEGVSLIAIDEAYNYYLGFCNKNKIVGENKYIVSKRYFEKYLYFTLNNYIEFDKFISCDWYL